MSILIKNAKVRGHEELVDVWTKEAKIIKIQNHITEEADFELDAMGKLLSVPFIESHVHLDATQTVGKVRENKSGTLMEAAKIWSETKEILTIEEIRMNARKTIQWEIERGIQYIRTHIDIIDDSLKGLRAINELKEELKEQVDIQIIAFPRTFADQRERTERLIQEAIEIGIDGIGGSPQTEFTHEDGLFALETIFEVAKKNDLFVDVHTDETSDEQSRFVEQIIKLTFEYEMFGKVTASHTTAMQNYDSEYAMKIIHNLKRADINVVVNPTSNALLQNRLEGYPKRRGLTRVDDLLAAGVNVSVGTDNIRDPFGPFGNGSLLHSVHLLAHMGHLSRMDDIPRLFDMITTNAATTVGKVREYKLEERVPADFILLDAESEYDAIRTTAGCLLSVKNGKVIFQK